MSTRTIVLAAALLVLAILPATRCAADADDTAVDQVFSALRDGNFSAATAHFNHTMKAALSPAMLETAWKQTYADQGPLLSWKILERQNLPGGDEVSVQLNFEHASAISTLAVASQNGEIASLFFKLPQSNTKSSQRKIYILIRSLLSFINANLPVLSWTYFGPSLRLLNNTVPVMTG